MTAGLIAVGVASVDTGLVDAATLRPAECDRGSETTTKLDIGKPVPNYDEVPQATVLRANVTSTIARRPGF